MNTDMEIFKLLKPFVFFPIASYPTDPTWCIMVVVGGDHISKLDEVRKKVEEIPDTMTPEVMFVFLNDKKYPESIFRMEYSPKYPGDTRRGDSRSPTVVSCVLISVALTD